MATVPVEMTAVAGAVLTAAQWNSNVRDAVNFLISVPIFEGRQTVAQSIPNVGTGASILMDTEDVDNDGGHSTITNTSRYTAQTAGRWQASGSVSYASNATGTRESNLLVNGTLTYSSKYNAVNGDTSRFPTRTVTHFLNAGDFMEVAGWQNTGGALNTAVTLYEQATFSMRWVGTT